MTHISCHMAFQRKNEGQRTTGSYTATCPLIYDNILKNIFIFQNTPQRLNAHRAGKGTRHGQEYIWIRKWRSGIKRTTHKKGRLHGLVCLVFFPAPPPSGWQGFGCTVEDHDIPLGQDTGFLQHLLFRQFRDGIPNLPARFL